MKFVSLQAEILQCHVPNVNANVKDLVYNKIIYRHKNITIQAMYV
jgi:hypothetical protein